MRLSEGSIQAGSSLQEQEKTFSYIGDKNGIMNRYTAVFDSAISYIDTTTHYRYFIKFGSGYQL